MHLHLYYKSCIPLTTYLYINSHSVFVCIRNQRSDFDAISSLLLPKEKFKINPIYIISTTYCGFISHPFQQQQQLKILFSLQRSSGTASTLYLIKDDFLKALGEFLKKKTHQFRKKHEIII